MTTWRPPVLVRLVVLGQSSCRHYRCLATFLWSPHLGVHLVTRSVKNFMGLGKPRRFPTGPVHWASNFGWDRIENRLRPDLIGGRLGSSSARNRIVFAIAAPFLLAAHAFDPLNFLPFNETGEDHRPLGHGRLARRKCSSFSPPVYRRLWLTVLKWVQLASVRHQSSWPTRPCSKVTIFAIDRLER